jgi:dienelactone hydrolase
MRIPFALCLFLCAFACMAAPRTEPISWNVGDTQFDGYLVWDDAVATPRPGLLMVPNWYGINERALEKASTLAGQDYVILLVDMYGRGVRPANPEQAGQAARAVYADRPQMRARIQAALSQLRGVGTRAPVDPERVGAIGFCFGGATVLELARSGAELDGVVSFHGNLSTPLPAQAGAVRARVLAMNGADDSFVPAEQIAGFEAEMRAAGVDWQFVNFGGAVHCFAEPDEDGSAIAGCRYHEPSYRRSLRMMHEFFDEAFAAR